MFDTRMVSGSASTSPGVVGEAWSTYLPDGLLADMLDAANGGSTWERLERIGGWDRVIAWAQAVQLREIAGFATAARADPAFGDNADQIEASVAAEVGLMTRLAPRTAAGRVADAVLLVSRLPATMRALAEGVISLPAARALAEETVGLDPADAGTVETRVLRGSGVRTPGRVRATARREVAKVDSAAVRRRAEAAQRQRHVRLIPEPDGMATISAYLAAPDAVGLYGVLDECARRAGGAGDHRSTDARRADALVDLVLDRLARPDCAGRDCAGRDSSDSATPNRERCGPGTRDRVDVQVRVTVALTTLLGLDQLPGELAGYGPIPADTARELAGRGTWRRLLTDPVSGALLDFGMTRYRPPPRLAEHVTTRDQTCDFPACRIPAHRCDLDHRVPYDPSTGTGPTNPENLGARCRGHHNLKASSGWTVTRRSDGTITWRTPSDHTYHRPPTPIGEPIESAPGHHDPPF
jgi:hypothetical protein